MAEVEQWTKHGALYVCGAECNNYRLNDHEAGLSGWLLSKVDGGLRGKGLKVKFWSFIGHAVCRDFKELLQGEEWDCKGKLEPDHKRLIWHAKGVRKLWKVLELSVKTSETQVHWCQGPRTNSVGNISSYCRVCTSKLTHFLSIALSQHLTFFFFFSLQLQFPENTMWVFKWWPIIEGLSLSYFRLALKEDGFPCWRKW